MKLTRMLAMTALAVIGCASSAASGNELKAQEVNRGRSGTGIVFTRVLPKVTVGISHAGRGIGTDSRAEKPQPKVRWHNPSRSIAVPQAMTNR